jgi:repressor LexA
MTNTPDDQAVHWIGTAALTGRQRAILESIRTALDKNGYPPSMREIGKEVGLISASSVQHQLRALEKKGYLRRDPRRPRAMELVATPPDAKARRSRAKAKAAPQSIVYHLGERMPEPTLVPLVGDIAAGSPIVAEQSVEDVFPLPPALVGDGDLFMLKVSGDSMVNAAICDGDWVVVRQQPMAENGEIVAAMIDGEATVKRLSHTPAAVWLLPENPAYEPIPGADAEILGKVVSVLRAL